MKIEIISARNLRSGDLILLGKKGDEEKNVGFVSKS